MFGKKQMEKDVVCGMDVDPNGASSSVHMGKTFFFCSSDCKQKFDSDPHKYMSGQMGHSHGGCC